MQDNVISDVVQNYIRQFLHKQKLENYVFQITKGTARGDNFLGIISKVDIIGKENGNVKTLHLIVKSAPKNEVFRKHASVRKVYLREIYVYTDILPAFIKFQEERNVSNRFDSFAPCYATIQQEMDEALIMENMQELEYVVPDRNSTLNYNHALLVMQEYGRFHALSFALRDQNPKLFAKLAENMEDEHFKEHASEANSDSLAKGLRETTERALRALDPIADKDAYERFRTYHERASKAIGEAASSEAAGKYAVFGHGDCWLNNILFKYKNSAAPDAPTSLCFLDWQFARLGSPALDLSYFLFSCIDEHTRTKHFDGLVRAYYDSFCKFLRILGSDPDRLFPFDVLQAHLKRFSVYGLHMAMIILYLIVSDPNEIPEFQVSGNEEETMEKFQYETKNIQKYYERFRPVVNHFVQYNYEF